MKTQPERPSIGQHTSPPAADGMDGDSLQSVIMIIRHGEKPAGGDHGVAFDGAPKKKSLTVAGWARAGALVELFAPVAGPVRTGLFRPRALFASNRHGPGRGSDREQETLRLLARRLGVDVNSDCGIGEEERLIGALSSTEGPVLICWKHDYIPRLVACLTDVDRPVPSSWPEDRYDVVWVFARSGPPGTCSYRFSQIPELLLPGDLAEPIS